MKYLKSSMCAAFALLLLTFSMSPVFAQVPAATGLGFGGALAASDNDIFVGAGPVGWPRGDEPAGAIYHYTQSAGGEWTEAARLSASDGGIGDFFGRSLYTNGEILLVGAPGFDAVYVFEKSADGSWQETGKVEPSSLDEDMEFGGAAARGGYRSGAVTMAGDRIVVAAFYKPSIGLRVSPRNENAQSGQVFVFAKEGDAWVEEAVLTPTEMTQDGFGYALAGDDGMIAIGAPGTGEGSGAVHVFKKNAAGDWAGSVLQPGGSDAARSFFGAGVALLGDELYVGAPGYDRVGAVLGYTHKEDGIWEQDRRLDVFELYGRQGGFGRQVALSGKTLVASNTAGQVYAFQRDKAGDGWSAMHQIVAPNERIADGFGIGVAARDGLVVVGSPRADYEEGIASVYGSQNKGAWQLTGTLLSEVVALSSIYGDKVICEDGKASYFECDKVDLISFMSRSEISPYRGSKMTDIWGWEDPETGKEYVLQGREDGTAFIDISDPYNPVYVGQLMKTEGAPGSSWRDVKVYKDHAFVVADGADAHGVQILDLNQLRDVKPADMPVDFKETALYKGVHSSHNIVINEDTGFAYAVGNRAGGEVCGGQLHMINVQDPKNPTFAGCFSHPQAGGTHDAQCVLYNGPDAKYKGKEVCLNSNGDSFIIADVTDKENPRTISHTTYPNLAYTHQGWLSEDQRYFYLNDELDEMNGSVGQTRTLIWDVKELEDPILVKEFLLDSKASDHNLYIKGNLLYESNYQAGLRILDISDPENPVEVANFDTVPFGEDEAGFGGSWSNYPYFKSGIIAVSSRGEGMFLLKKQEVDL